VTVAGDATDGDPSAPRGSVAKLAANSYALVQGGDGSGDPGDGVVPLAAAHLEGATQVTLQGVLHSVNVAGSGAPTDQWYGAEPVIDRWLPQVLEAYRTSRGQRGAAARKAREGNPFAELARLLGRA
jgi:hypothetical protein